MSQVIMVADIGGKELHIGKCTHAQARILTKKEHGEIREGKLYLHIRPLHLQIAASHSFRAPEDDDNVSNAELKRREMWLTNLIGKTIEVEEKARKSGIKEIVEGADLAARSHTYKGIVFQEEKELTEDEVADFFREAPEDLPELPTDMWGGGGPGRDWPADLAAVNRYWYLDSHESGSDWTMERQGIAEKAAVLLAQQLVRQAAEWEGDSEAIRIVAVPLRPRKKLSDRWEFQELGEGYIMVPKNR